MKKIIQQRGFTLMELLVVVLVIGILTSVAVPQYRRAVLKSRFSTLMPLAKSVAQGNEVFYQGRGYYANDVDELDIQAPSVGTNATIELASIEKSENGFDYVLARRSDVPGLAYVVYQEHSGQFPGTFMCEANDTLNPQASELCEKGLSGRAVSNGSLQGDDWKAYLLLGEQGSSKFTACTGAKPQPITAANSGATGTATCNEETGEYTYTWSGGNTYNEQNSTMTGTSAYAYAGSIFSGRNTYCQSQADHACTGATFSGEYSYCKSGVSNDQGCSNSVFSGEGSHCEGGAGDCANSIFSGIYSYCVGEDANACQNSLFSGEGSNCIESNAPNGCAGSTFQAGSYCSVNITRNPNVGCNNVTYEPGSYCVATQGRCASGTPAGYTYVESGNLKGAAYEGECWDGNGNHGAEYCTQN